MDTSKSNSGSATESAEAEDIKYIYWKRPSESPKPKRCPFPTYIDPSRFIAGRKMREEDYRPSLKKSKLQKIDSSNCIWKTPQNNPCQEPLQSKMPSQHQIPKTDTVMCNSKSQSLSEFISNPWRALVVCVILICLSSIIVSVICSRKGRFVGVDKILILDTFTGDLATGYSDAPKPFHGKK